MIKASEESRLNNLLKTISDAWGGLNQDQQRAVIGGIGGTGIGALTGSLSGGWKGGLAGGLIGGGLGAGGGYYADRYKNWVNQKAAPWMEDKL